MMKKLLTIVLALASGSALAQLSCEIYAEDTVVCAGQPIQLFTDNSPDHLYRWTPGEGITTIPFTELEIWGEYTVYLEIFNRADTSFVCEDSLTLNVWPRMIVEIEQQVTGCPDECKAQAQAFVEGGFPPYRFLWAADVPPNDSSRALGLCSNDEYALFVYDTVCVYDTSFLVEGYDMPEIELSRDPSDSVFKVNPQVTFFYENLSSDSIPITNWFWEFSDGTTSPAASPTHVFRLGDSVMTDTVYFHYTTIDNCDSSMMITIDIRELELTVPNVFTPNGDNINDLWEIPQLEAYVGNELVVFNRWGQKVYERSNYGGDWDGGSLPDGTYFYILRCYGYFKEEVFRGAVMILGSGN